MVSYLSRILHLGLYITLIAFFISKIYDLGEYIRWIECLKFSDDEFSSWHIIVTFLCSRRISAKVWTKGDWKNGGEIRLIRQSRANAVNTKSQEQLLEMTGNRPIGIFVVCTFRNPRLVFSISGTQCQKKKSYKISRQISGNVNVVEQIKIEVNRVNQQ